MSDFYSVLKQTIIDRGLRSARDREVAYSQARTAMIRRLWTYDPPLSEDEIDARIGQFDLAVDRIEDDVVEVFATQPEPAAAEPEPADLPAPPPVYGGYDQEADYAPAFGGAPAHPAEDAPEAGGAAPETESSRTVNSLANLLSSLDVRSLAVEQALNADPDDEPPEAGDDSEAEPPPPPRRAPPSAPVRASLPVPARVRQPVAYDDLVDYDDPTDVDEPFDDPDPEPDARSLGERPMRDITPPADPPLLEARRLEPPRGDPRRPEARRPDPRRAEARRPRRAPEKKPRRTRAVGSPDESTARRSPGRPRNEERSPASRGLVVLVAAVGVLAVALVSLVAYVLWPSAGDPVSVAATEAPPVPARQQPSPAARVSPPANQSAQRFTLFDGTDPTVFDADPSNPIRFDGSVARVSTSSGSAGARVLVGPGLAARLAGNEIRVSVMVRAARENGAASLRMAYQSGLAVSHWQTTNLTSEFTALELVWRVPTLRTDPSGNAIIIEPGIPGDGTAAEIGAIAIDLVE